MRKQDHCEWEEDPWEGVRLTKVAIRARVTLLVYTAVVSAPFIAVVIFGAIYSGLKPYQVLGTSCYYAMVSSIIFFDTLRNAAHECFDKAQADGVVNLVDGIPCVDPSYPNWRLARLSFAIGGRTQRKRD